MSRIMIIDSIMDSVIVVLAVGLKVFLNSLKMTANKMFLTKELDYWRRSYRRLIEPLKTAWISLVLCWDWILSFTSSCLILWLQILRMLSLYYIYRIWLLIRFTSRERFPWTIITNFLNFVTSYVSKNDKYINN